MQKILNLITKILAVIVVILFVFSVVLALFLAYTRIYLLNPDFIKSALSDLSIYKKLPTISTDLILQTPLLIDLANTGYIPPPFVQKIPAEDLEEFLGNIYTSQVFQNMTESILDSIFSFLYGDTDQIIISLNEIKKPLSGLLLEQTLQYLLDTQPECNPDEVKAITSALPAELIPVCKPPDELRNLYLSYLRQQMVTAVDTIPDEFLINFPAPLINSSSIPEHFGINSLADIRLLLRLLVWIPFLPLIFLLGIAILAVRSLKGGLRWLGIPIFFSGFLALGVNQLVLFSARPALAAALDLQNSTYLTPDIVTFINDLGKYIVDNLTDWIQKPSLFLLAVGLIVWMISYSFKRKIPPVVLHPDISTKE